MTILLIKADQLHLFEKLVQVKAAIRKDGTVQSAHTAVRHVKAPEPKKAHKPEVLDLFGQGHEVGAKPASTPVTPIANGANSAPEPAGMTMEEVRAKREAREAAEREAPAEVVETEASATPVVESEPAPDYHEAAAADRDAAKQRVIEKRLARLQERRDPDGIETRAAAGTEPVEGPAAVSLFRGLDYSGPDLPPIPVFGVPAGIGKAERRAINARAADMVTPSNDLLAPPPEPLDPRVLAQYSGNGGCGDSLNEFYTDPAVAAAMWKVLADLGAVGPGATVLEPSCATGVFMATAPKGVTLTGIEIDGTSAKIAAALHPAHEVVHSPMEAFATSDTRQFDAVIGNAPFGTRGACQRQDKRDLSLHEAYFMDTALDKAKPGGVVAMIVNTTLMNSKNMRKVRERLLRKGEFLGAIRMPNTAFEAAHTDVTSDVLFFRKRPDDVAGALSVVDQDTLKKLGVWDEEYLAGSYFEGRGSENVLGEVGTAMRAFGEIYTVNGSMQGVPQALAAFKPDSESAGPDGVPAVLDAAPADQADRIRGAAATKAYETAKRGDVKVVDGVRYILEGDPLRWHRVDEFAAQQAVIDAAEVGVAIEKALAGDPSPGLEEKVRDYVAKHGIPSKNVNLQIAAKTDKVIYRLLGAVKPDGSLSDLVTGKTASPPESSFDAAAQGLALEVGFFTPSMVAGRWHEGTEETILDHLYASPDYALDPVSGTWTSLDNYLTGELWPKLDAVKAALGEGGDPKPEDRAKFERQAAALEETIQPKSLEDVECMLNSAFIPLPVVAAFFNERPRSYSHGDLVLTFDEGVYAASGGNYDTKLLLKYLNRSGVRKEDDLPTIDRWNLAFKEWLCASDYRDEVEELYNRTFRGFRQKAYSDKPFDVPGLRSEGLKSYQWSGLRWALEAGKGIIAADVGLGKTARALILNKLLKATGRAKKPLIIVPKSVAANWMREAEKWFPGSNVLVIGETYTKDKKGELKGRADTAAERDRKFHDLTQNDYDFVLITQPAWNDLDLDPETRGRLQESDFWEQRKKGLENAKDKKRQAIRDKWDSAKVKEEFERRSGAIYFNDLGVDALISDEMHAYKNLFEAKDRFGQTPKFLGGSGSSKRAADMRYKAAWLREQTGGSNVYGLTATPTKNSPLEVYSMLSHIAPEAFERIGIRNSEEFLDRFCVFEERNVLTTTGQMDRALCTVGFKNLDELREIMRRYIDRKTAEDVGLQLPTADHQQHLLDMSAAQKEVYGELREQAEKAAQEKEASGEGHIFSIMARMAKASLDLEIFDPVRFAGAKSPKYDALAAKVAAGRKEGGQIVFCDHIEAHDKIVAALEAAGVPKSEIGIINAQVAPTSAKRQNIAEAYRAGKLRVVIGNTATMGEGVDGLQADTTDIHHMDWPWEPATLQQRNGRGRRQGNTAESIRIHSYLGKGTFDGYRYQTVMAKGDWQDALWNGGDRVENLAMQGSLSRDDMLVMLADDPEAARKKLEENKTAAEARLNAIQFGEAADAFTSYRAKKATLSKMKDAGKATLSGQRLQVHIERLRTALEDNPYFKAKHLLDVDHDVLLQPETGVSFEPGKAFKAGADAGINAGHYVVEKVHPDHNLVQVRRWGSTGAAGRSSFALDKLGTGIEPIDHDEAAEAAHVAEHAAADIGSIASMAKLAELPSAAINKNYAAVQKHVRDGLASYKFDVGYGDIGLVTPDGKATATQSYNASKLPADHDVMLPTDEHKRLAFDAFHDDQSKVRFESDYSNRRNPGGTVARWPGAHDQGSNRWNGVIQRLWGPDAVKDAKAESEKRMLEAARQAPTMAEAMKHLVSATTESGSRHDWSREALATAWAAAKAHGATDAALHSHTRAPAAAFSMLSGGYPQNVGGAPAKHALSQMAAARGFHDLAAAIATESAETPEAAVQALLKLPDHKHRRDAIAHQLEKDPSLAGRTGRDLGLYSADGHRPLKDLAERVDVAA